MRWFLALALAALVSGCVNPADLTGPGGAGGPGADREVQFTVISAERLPGRCFDGAEAFGDVCDQLVVRVDNSGYMNALDVGPLVWKAHDADGRTTKVPQSSHDEVAGGAVADIRLGFTQEDGAPSLTTLIYQGFQGHGEAAAPAP